MAFCNEALFQFFEILYNSVVAQRNRPRAIRMRMRVFFCNASVRCPARMENADTRIPRRINALLKVFNLSHGARGNNFPFIQKRKARGVVSAVLKRPKPVNTDLDRVFLADVAHNAAHIYRTKTTWKKVIRPQKYCGMNAVFTPLDPP